MCLGLGKKGRAAHALASWQGLGLSGEGFRKRGRAMEGRVAIAPVKAFEQNVRVCKAKSSMVCVCVGGVLSGAPCPNRRISFAK